MPETEAGGIFISYRRQESSHLAGRLADRLADRFGEGQVFIDVDTIEPGADFAEEISRAVAACRVLLAVIGPTWLTAADERGRRRLDDPDDTVRLEIEAALDRDVRVIPILVEGAVMPGRPDLPERLARLARLNALLIRHESFRSDAARLVTAIERVLAKAPVPREPPKIRKTGEPRSWTNSNDDLALARSVWGKFSPRAKALFSLLMDDPGRKVSGKDLASTLDIPNGASGVAGVLAWPARHCAAVNRVGPWRWEYRSEEDKAYYWIDPEVASLFKKVRN